VVEEAAVAGQVVEAKKTDSSFLRPFSLAYADLPPIDNKKAHHPILPFLNEANTSQRRLGNRF
jgi:hypothetical protein